MKNKLARALSVALACSMVTSSSTIAFAAPTADTNGDETLKVTPKPSDESLRLWYDKPSSEGVNRFAGANANQEVETWQQFTLPIGNGDLGANVYGEIESERLTFNEKTLWTGGPSSKRPNYIGGNLENKGRNGETVKEIQQLFLQGFNKEASSKCGELVGTSDGYGAYQAWGDIYFDYKNVNADNVTNYVRDLDLSDSTASVSFVQDGTTYEREYFVSHPDNVLVAKLTAKNGGKLSLDIRFPSKQGGTTVANGNTLTLAGQVADNQLKYSSLLKAVNTGGTVTANGDKLTVEGAESVIVYVSAVTDYKNDYPVYRTGEDAAALLKTVTDTVNAASAKEYETLKDRHIEDYKSIFDRAYINLGQAASSKPINELLNAYNNKTATPVEQRTLEMMLFQMGRYLTISSSREDSKLPSNLQGVWNNRNNPPWSSDYHMNVNLQMNYWPTYSTNMAECAKPLVSYIDSLREPGRVTAKIYAGVESTTENPENGFMAHTQNTPFGWTCPGWSFDWGWSPAAVPWILQNCWEYYEFTGDKEYMKNNLYPMMKEESTLYDQILIRNNEGDLVSAPSYSPEHGPRTMGNTYEHALIWQLYNDTIDAANILGVDAEKVATWESNMNDLKGPIEVGDDGQIKEWYEETTLGSIASEGFGHRHLSHMLGLFPGDLITEDTPEWFQAAKVSMNNRTDASTGWGMGQRINTWARLQEGNRAHKLITDLFKNGMYQNLWDTHTPFQIDGNFGMTSGVAEMLLQSNAGFINILPGLPDVWADGSYEGLVARGNFEVDATWADKKATNVEVTSKNGGNCILQYDGISLADIKDSKGKHVEVTTITEDRVSFETTKGETYTITGLDKAIKVAKPENVEGLRIADDKVLLSWDAVEGASEYTVSRKIGNGSYKYLATTTDPSYLDEDASTVLGSISYQIKATVDNQISDGTVVSVIKDMRNMGMIDDSDSRISYSSGWGTYNEAGGVGKGFHFVESSNNHTATLKFVGSGIKVIANKNSTFGDLDVTIDGVEEAKNLSMHNAGGKIRKQVIFEKTDLSEGIHTITINAHPNAANPGRAKVEFDAFEVLQTGNKVSAITVNSKSGATVIGKAAGTMQMVAQVAPEDADNKAVTWSVSGAGATISESGLLTAGNESGTATVTATAADGSQVVGTKTITIDVKNDGLVETFVEDSDPAIVYAEGWNNWPDAAHHGGTIKYNEEAVGKTITYAFNGVGIAVIAPKHSGYADYKVTIDGVDKGTFATGDAADSKQQTIYEVKNLTDGAHTIILTGVANGTAKKLEFDCFKVFTKSATEVVNRAELQAKLQEVDALVKNDYSTSSWTSLQAAVASAVTVMNNMGASKTQVDQATTALGNAIAALQPAGADTTAPSAVTNLKVVGLEDTAATLTWTASVDDRTAVTYKVMNGNDVVAENIKDTFYSLSELKANTAYEYKVFAVDEAGNAATAATVTFTTKGQEDVNAPTAPTGVKVSVVSDTSSKLTWNASVDAEGSAVSYDVFLDGTLVKTTNETTIQLNDLVKDQEYVVKLRAKDAKGNISSVVTVVFVAGKADVIPPVVDKAPLQAAIEKANGYKEDKYTADSFGKLKKAISDAQKVFEDPNADLKAVEEAIDDINTAINNLQEITAPAKKNGWYKEAGKWRYYVDNKPSANKWVKDAKGKWYYAGKDGWMATNWQKIDKFWYYLGTDGMMVTGWAKVSNVWYYLAPSGKMLTGWQKISGSWYLLASSGKMLTGWQKNAGSWYYLASSGKMKTGWLKDGGKWYYLASSGKMTTGWVKVSSKWYYMDGSGKMMTGWVKVNGKWYYLKSTGEMATGWTYVNKKYYYLNTSTGAWSGQTK